jgi:hypothetical protein
MERVLELLSHGPPPLSQPSSALVASSSAAGSGGVHHPLHADSNNVAGGAAVEHREGQHYLKVLHSKDGHVQLQRQQQPELQEHHYDYLSPPQLLSNGFSLPRHYQQQQPQQLQQQPPSQQSQPIYASLPSQRMALSGSFPVFNLYKFLPRLPPPLLL